MAPLCGRIAVRAAFWDATTGPFGLETNGFATREAMEQFLSIHQGAVVGTLTMFDRIIFKGYLTRLFMGKAFEVFLSKQGVLLKNFGAYVEQTTAELKTDVKKLAQQAGRPYVYLDSAVTKAKGRSKEDLARSIAEADGITDGLICILATVETCSSFGVRKNPTTQKLAIERQRRKCLHFYFYYFDAEFGFLPIRLQSWFPFTIQVYVNGREWLGRELARAGIPAERYENAFLQIADLAAAQALGDHFAHREWPRVLDALARRVNPKLALVENAGFGTYYWVIDQCEIATDVMFHDRARLLDILPDLLQGALLAFSAQDVLRFLGRKLHGNFQAEVTSDLKKRPEGWRVKHFLAGNSLKMYDKFSVLRIEATINNSREFKVLQVTGDERRWVPMSKGVANMWRYYQVALQANQRYLNALANVQLKGEAVRELDDLCRSQTKDGKRFAKFNPVAPADAKLFAAAMAGEHLLNGFRNNDLCARLYDGPSADPTEANRRCARVSRLIAKLRGHRLVAKVKGSRLYRVTARGYRILSAALGYRLHQFPEAFQAA
ncbi:MAG: hypothetical protein HYY04_03095 [Chloroflexi bacterium]|nr:hypothetical protein [Chloroflexota bacterium]